MIEFSWTISIGTIIEVVTIIGGGSTFLWSMKYRIDQMTTDIHDLKTEIGKLSEVLTKLAVQDQRILSIEKNLDELRHGIGFVNVKPQAH